MIEIEVVIVIAVALVVWLFVHFRKKRHESEVETVVVPEVPVEAELQPEPEPEPEPKPELKKEPMQVETAELSEFVGVIPEDSALRRHYLQNQAIAAGELKIDKPVVELEQAPELTNDESLPIELTEVSDITDIIPEDSTLRRHYLQNLANIASDADTVSDKPVVVDVAEECAIKSDVIKVNPGTGIPEDVVLRRHFIQQITTETEAKMPPRPSDSTLKRHYDAQLLSSVISQLQALK